MKVCKRCKKPSDDFPITRRNKPSTMCQRCYDDTSTRNAKKYDRMKRHETDVSDGKRLCLRCRKVRPIEEFQTNGRNFRRIAQGLVLSNKCQTCRKYAARKAEGYRSQWTPEKKEQERQKQKEFYQKCRTEMLGIYGHQCTCCGETTPEFLAFDHVNNDGAHHRKKMVGWDFLALYRWAKRHGFPDSLQVLCHNCNVAKETCGVCPHQVAKEANVTLVVQ